MAIKPTEETGVYAPVRAPRVARSPGISVHQAYDKARATRWPGMRFVIHHQEPNNEDALNDYLKPVGMAAKNTYAVYQVLADYDSMSNRALGAELGLGPKDILLGCWIDDHEEIMKDIRRESARVTGEKIVERTQDGVDYTVTESLGNPITLQAGSPVAIGGENDDR